MFKKLKDLKWLDKQNQHAARKVGQAALKGQTDGQTCRTHQSHDRGGIHADAVGQEQNQQEIQEQFNQGIHELYHAHVGPGPIHGTADDLADYFYESAAHDKQDNRQQKPEAKAYGHRKVLINVLLGPADLLGYILYILVNLSRQLRRVGNRS